LEDDGSPETIFAVFMPGVACGRKRGEEEERRRGSEERSRLEVEVGIVVAR
jgi:hypothetical protein